MLRSSAQQRVPPHNGAPRRNVPERHAAEAGHEQHGHDAQAYGQAVPDPHRILPQDEGAQDAGRNRYQPVAAEDHQQRNLRVG